MYLVFVHQLWPSHLKSKVLSTLTVCGGVLFLLSGSGLTATPLYVFGVCTSIVDVFGCSLVVC